MNPVENAWRWMRWKATGSEDAIAKVFSVLDTNLPSGWRRLTGDDLLRYGATVNPGSGWYGLDPAPPQAGVVLSMERPAPHLMVGGGVRFPGLSVPSGTTEVPAAWDVVGRFLDEGIIPAVRAAGASIHVPTPEEVFFSELPIDVRGRIQRFTDAACKSLPLESKEAELWRAFVVAVFRMEARFDIEPFVDWMAAVGWPRESAAELYSQLVDDCLLLSRYADEVSAA